MNDTIFKSQKNSANQYSTPPTSKHANELNAFSEVQSNNTTAKVTQYQMRWTEKKSRKPAIANVPNVSNSTATVSQRENSVATPAGVSTAPTPSFPRSATKS